jgi:hypothetical protein
MQAVASADVFQNLYCVCLICYGPKVVSLDSSVPVLLYNLPVWGFSKFFHNVSCCITYHLPVACTQKQLSVPQVLLQGCTLSKYKTRHVWVTKSSNALTAGANWLRCTHNLRLKLRLTLPLIPVCSLHLKWICNHCVGFWIRDGSK